MGKRETLKYDIDEDFANEEAEEETKPRYNPCPVSDMELVRLRDCAVTSKMGLEDQGFPQLMAKLAAKSYVQKITVGYRITPDGLALLSQWNRKLRRL